MILILKKIILLNLNSLQNWYIRKSNSMLNAFMRQILKSGMKRLTEQSLWL